MFSAFVDHKNNAYSFHCEIVGHHMYRTACQRRMTDESELTPEVCKGACRHRTCPSLRMREEEKDAGEVIYYVDRDDAGPGIASRAEVGERPRSEIQIREHHKILADLGRKPVERPVHVKREIKSVETGKKVSQKAVSASVTASKDVFDIGATITKKAASL